MVEKVDGSGYVNVFLQEFRNGTQQMQEAGGEGDEWVAW